MIHSCDTGIGITHKKNIRRSLKQPIRNPPEQRSQHCERSKPTKTPLVIPKQQTTDQPDVLRICSLSPEGAKDGWDALPKCHLCCCRGAVGDLRCPESRWWRIRIYSFLVFLRFPLFFCGFSRFQKRSAERDPARVSCTRCKHGQKHIKAALFQARNRSHTIPTGIDSV